MTLEVNYQSNLKHGINYILKIVYQYGLYTLLEFGIDLIGSPPTTSNGKRYILTLVDYFSKQCEAAPLMNNTVASVDIFLYELFCRSIAIFSYIMIQGS